MAVEEHRLAALPQWMRTSPIGGRAPPGVRFRIRNEQGWIAGKACAATADSGVPGSRG